MRAFGLSLGVLVTSIGLTLIPVGTAAADTESREGSFPVPAGPSHGETGSSVLLKAGVTYRIAVTGSVSQSAGADGFTTDALYCYQGSAPDSPCNQHYPIGADALGLAFRTPGFREPDSSEVKSLADFGTNKSIAYDDGHHYDQFVSPASDVYLFAMTFPGKNPGDGLSYGGGFTITINRVIPGPGTGPPPGSNGADVDCVIRQCTPSFGPNFLYSSPAPGSLLAVPAPNLPKKARQTTLTVTQPGAKPTPVAATAPVITDEQSGTLLVCLFWGGEALRPNYLDDIFIGKNQDLGPALVAACLKLLAVDFGQTAAHSSASSCRATFVPIVLRGTRMTEGKRRRMVAAAKRRVRTSCRRSSDGGLKLVLGARGRGKTVRSLVRGAKPKLVLVRRPAQEADPPNARIGFRWGH